jgi:putative polyhydroxyalkanoate system protein
MTTIDITQAHRLPKDEAVRALERLVRQLQDRYKLGVEWRGEVLHFGGPGLNGTVEVHEHHVHIVVTLGALLSVMKPKIESKISAGLQKLLAGPGG